MKRINSSCFESATTNEQRTHVPPGVVELGVVRGELSLVLPEPPHRGPRVAVRVAGERRVVALGGHHVGGGAQVVDVRGDCGKRRLKS